MAAGRPARRILGGFDNAVPKWQLRSSGFTATRAVSGCRDRPAISACRVAGPSFRSLNNRRGRRNGWSIPGSTHRRAWREPLLQLHFGTGIVKTAEDFGAQGDPPSICSCDWLATEFIRTTVGLKAMQRLMVISATYRQSSRVTPELHERDPENRLLARARVTGCPRRWCANNALAASGLLVDKVGGPSVFPYQPKGSGKKSRTARVLRANLLAQPRRRSLSP